MLSINILFPVYNEQNRIEIGVINTVKYLDTILHGKYQVTIVDNGSNDQTGYLGKQLSNSYSQVQYLFIAEKGVGAAFRAGVLRNTSDIVGYMDIDLSTDIHHLHDVIDIFQKNSEVDIVNGSRLSALSVTKGRKWYRKLTSKGLASLMKSYLGLRLDDPICGFKFFRKDKIALLLSLASTGNGWFYIIEILLRAQANSLFIVEIPVRWTDDHDSSVKIFRLITYYILESIRMKRRLKQNNIVR